MGAVHLVRHGQASFGAEDYDVLSELGKRQAEHLGRTLRERGTVPGLVRSGSLTRQQDTARLCADAAGYTGECGLDPRWNEYDHVDVLACYPPDPPDPQIEHLAHLTYALRRWMADGDGGPCAESWSAFRSRVAAALADALAAAPPAGAVVVTSGGVIAAVCAELLGLGADGYLAINLAAANTGVSTIIGTRRGPTLLTFNDLVHVSGEHRDLLSYL